MISYIIVCPPRINKYMYVILYKLFYTVYIQRGVCIYTYITLYMYIFID